MHCSVLDSDFCEHISSVQLQEHAEQNAAY